MHNSLSALKRKKEKERKEGRKEGNAFKARKIPFSSYLMGKKMLKSSIILQERVKVLFYTRH